MKEIYAIDDETGASTDQVIARQEDASTEAVETILSAPIGLIGDGRSNFKWFRLQDGTLILGVYPQGDTYFATEHMRTI